MGEFRKSLCTSGESHRLRKKKNTQEDLFTLQADYWHRTKNNQRNRIKLNQLKKENKKKKQQTLGKRENLISIFIRL